ncbi:hypothetical protein CMQ_1325 [Grosmannia clavigera kw1407]|uniref:Uncharacterized protein n=1 Tax=Grosmannia clavigera (strain kw1407 / UAMH 11150) TaxID=655863 RepID=F0XFR9_GROCL|nr:uncharacterized protein CMQ_1325 [Grosmannia clavigera kw1407]EFX04397.1 hypothetical protein CMQ_1325 [Grosmannia clavigera kw1407]
MTRVTAPISKLARSLSANPSVARPAYLVNAAHNHNGVNSASAWSEHGEREDASRHFTTTHRPTSAPVPSRNRIVPLMQTFTFRTTAPKAVRLDTSTIDNAVMPIIAEPVSSSLHSIRVPLLPDNFAPNREGLVGHAPEAVDGLLATPHVLVVAAHPELVTPASPLAEMESIGVDGTELKFAHTLEDSQSSSSSDKEPGMLRDLWKGIVEGVIGEKKVAH